MLGWFYSLSLVPIATATALSFTAAIFASLGAVVLLGERVRLRRWTAIVLGFIGVLVVLRPGSEAFQPATLIVLFASLMWGTGVVIVKKLSSTDDAVSIVGWMSIMLTVLPLPPALYVWQTPSAQNLVWLSLIGAAATAGHLAMVHALKLAEATAIMSVDFARLLWATLIGYLAFAEVASTWTWVGGAIIFSSGIYIIYRESRVAPARLRTPAPP